MLQFIRENQEELVKRTREKVRSRLSPTPTPAELESGVPLFLTQFIELLDAASGNKPPNAAIRDSATRRGNDLLRQGFTIAQVVHDYGDVCQAVTELASHKAKQITTEEFHTLNLCLDNAIAAAVTEYSRQREQNLASEEIERYDVFSRQLRNLIDGAATAYKILRGGSVGVGGSTGNVLEHTLTALRQLVDRPPVEVQQRQHGETRVVLSGLMAEVAAAASRDAIARRADLILVPVAKDLTVVADRPMLASAVAGMVQNALRFTRPGGSVSLRASSRAKVAVIEAVADSDRPASGTICSFTLELPLAAA